MRRIRKNSGLSLLEVLVALAITVLIAVNLAEIMSFSARGVIHSKDSEKISSRIVQRTKLRELLMHAALLQAEQKLNSEFTGSQEGFSFLTYHSLVLIEKSYAQRVSVDVINERLEMNVVFLGIDGQALRHEKYLLSDHIRDHRISYYSKSPNDPKWVNNWGQDQGLPNLIKIEAMEGAKPEWPEFTVLLHSATQ